MELTIKYPNLPLRAYQKEQLENQIEALQAWLTNLLGLSGVESAKRLVIASEALKEQCIGMGFAEIQKMFEMYADSKLDIEPKTNYFDRVLLGKIVAEYRKYNMRKPKQHQIPEISDQEKKEIDDQILKDQEAYFKKHGVVNPDQWYAYDILDKRGLINLSLEEKKEIYADALEILKLEAHTKKTSSREDHQKNKNLLELLNQGKGAKIKAKELSLQQYYQKKFKK
tara:strand:- start:58 stop:735 length:678 start_codon:yes stop_codon:yes gene_type:complete